MRPQSELTQRIHEWVNQSNSWFSHFTIDSALGIETKKDKTLRRVTLKRLCDKGSLVRPEGKDGVYRKLTPVKKRVW